MKKIIMALLLFVCNGAYAQELSVNREPKSQEEFKTIIQSKLDSSLIKDKKVRLKLSEKDLQDVLSQVPLNDDETFSISFVRQVPEITTDELYTRIYQALVDVYVNAKNVIQMQDKENGLIVCKGIVKYTNSAMSSVNLAMGTHISVDEVIDYTIKIQVREGRYKVDIYDMIADESIFSDGKLTMNDFLNSSFYNTTYASGFSKKKRSDKGYQTTRLLYILHELNQLYDLEESIYNKVSSTGVSKDDW